MSRYVRGEAGRGQVWGGGWRGREVGAGEGGKTAVEIQGSIWGRQGGPM